MLVRVICENCKTIIEYNIKNKVGLDTASASALDNTDSGAILFDGMEEYIGVECPECGIIIGECYKLKD